MVTEVSIVELLTKMVEDTPQSQVLVSAVQWGIDCQDLERTQFISAINTDSKYSGHDDVDLIEYDNVVDDLSGEVLPAKLVQDARAAEIVFLKIFPVYEIVPRSISVGKKFLKIRWVDVNKGDKKNRNVRSRLVAKDFKFVNPYLTNTFAGVPPQEALRYFISFLVTIHRFNGRILEIIGLIVDVSRAHFHPFILREVYIDLPSEDPQARDGFVGKLLRTMYGTREASHEFEAFFNHIFASAGMVAGVSCPAIYEHESEPCIGCRHGDDVALAGERQTVMAIYKIMEADMHLRIQATLGFGPGDDRQVKLLNRLITLEFASGKRRVVYEVDPRHVELIVGMFGLKSTSRGVSSPGEKARTAPELEELVGSDCTLFRSGTMRLNYISGDLPHVQFAANSCAHFMSTPVVEGLTKLKRVPRYFINEPRVVQLFEEQEACTTLTVRADSNWAQSQIDRKSVSCVHLVLGKRLLKSYVGTQAGAPSLSSGEAEFIAAVRAGSLAIGMRSMLKDMGKVIKKITLGTDSNAAKGILSRTGLGKARHLHTGVLWIQHYVADGTFTLEKLDGKENSADLGTKELSAPDMWKCLKALNFERRGGHHDLALRFAES